VRRADRELSRARVSDSFPSRTRPAKRAREFPVLRSWQRCISRVTHMGTRAHDPARQRTLWALPRPVLHVARYDPLHVGAGPQDDGRGSTRQRAVASPLLPPRLSRLAADRSSSCVARTEVPQGHRDAETLLDPGSGPRCLAPELRLCGRSHRRAAAVLPLRLFSRSSFVEATTLET